MSKMNSVLTLVLLVTISSSLAAQAGLKMRITKKGIDYANTIAQAAIRAELQNLKLPDFPISAKHVSGGISNIRKKSVVGPTSSLSLNSGQSGLTWSLSGFSISLSADWRAKYKRGWFKISDHGRIDLGANGVSVTVTLSIGSSNGRPVVQLKQCDARIGSVSVKFHGGAAFIYNLFKGYVGRKIKEKLQPEICKQVEKAVNTDARNALAKFKVTADIENKFTVDYGLVGAASVTSQYLETLHKGEVFWKSGRASSPYTAPTLPSYAETSRMLYMWLTEYSANTFAYTAHKHGVLQYDINKADLPPSQAAYLDTTCSDGCAGTYLPQLASQYPNSSLGLRIRSSSAPRVTMTTKGTTVQLVADVDVLVIKPDRSSVSLLKLNVTFSVSFNLAISNERLVGSIFSHSFSISVVQSQIGNLGGLADSLDKIMGYALQFVVIPHANQLAQKGVELPTSSDINIKNAQFIHQNGFVIVAADVEYHYHR